MIIALNIIFGIFAAFGVYMFGLSMYCGRKFLKNGAGESYMKMQHALLNAEPTVTDVEFTIYREEDKEE